LIQPNPTHPIKTTDPTQPNPTHRKVKTLDPQTNPTHNPQPNRTPYNQQQKFGHEKDNSNISQSVKVYQVGLLLTYQHLSLSGYQVLLQQSQEAYQVLEFKKDVSNPRPNPTTKKLKISNEANPAQPNPTQPVGRPNQWTTLTHETFPIDLELFFYAKPPVFYSFTVLHGMQTRSSDENSVRLSVCLSVCPSVCLSNACIVTKR